MLRMHVFYSEGVSAMAGTTNGRPKLHIPRVTRFSRKYRLDGDEMIESVNKLRSDLMELAKPKEISFDFDLSEPGDINKLSVLMRTTEDEDVSCKYVVESGTFYPATGRIVLLIARDIRSRPRVIEINQDNTINIDSGLNSYKF